MVYELSRFSPQSFEQFIQALASSVLGAKVQIFGRGRDGAREATYRGPCNLADKEWDGYLVIQAKYHEVGESPASNARWLIKQIDQEMDKYADKDRALELPDFYLLASNVQLSASAADHMGKGSGGIDLVTEHLKKRASELGIKETHLWHADTLRSLIDVHKEVRTSFNFWVQPSDVLSALLEKIEGPDHKQVLFQYLRSAIRQGRDIKTRDAGQTTGSTIALNDIFFDLPVNASATDFYNQQTLSVDFLEDEDDDIERELTVETAEGEKRPRAMANLMLRCSDKLNPSEHLESRSKKPLPNRIVLLGGPGQGKSTVGQFLAQLCRARLLETTGGTQSPEVTRIVRGVLERAKAENIPMTGVLRYPIHVELPRFADTLNSMNKEQKELSILGYIAQGISSASGESVNEALLRRWLSPIPSIIILDGLDEVPHSGNRSNVISAIEALLDFVHEKNADTIVFVTSRPQGYQDELPSKFWSHWTLEGLNGGEALELSHQLAGVLIADETRRSEIINIMRSASEDGATSSLMTSPLQVTLLFHLVATHNNIPEDRWTLFARHYETLRDREIAKGGAQGQTIGKYKSQIDRIHYDAGYLLHLRAEQPGNSNSFFSMEEFSNLVRAQFKREGYEEDLEKLTQEIVLIATNRLVFLGCRTGEQVAFDVRSLQEFMAAARITTSPEERIRSRLTLIAGRSHWLHVFKIACSKIFSSPSHESLREMVVALIDSLNAGDRDINDNVTNMGSVLAFELLKDGLAVGAPIYRRRLLSRSVGLLPEIDDNDILALSELVDQNQKITIEPILEQLLCSEKSGDQRSALTFLSMISERDQEPISDWATEMLLKWWPSNPEIVLDAFGSFESLPNSGPVADQIRSTLWNLPPSMVLGWADQFDVPFILNNAELESEAFTFKRTHTTRVAQYRLNSNSMGDIRILYIPLRSRLELMPVPADARKEWHVLEACERFNYHISSDSLADFFKTIAESHLLDQAKSVPLPWLLQMAMQEAKCEDDLLQLEVSAREGKLGNPDKWFAAEKRWNESGIIKEDLIYSVSNPSIPNRIDMLGTPSLKLGVARARGTESTLSELLDLISENPEIELFTNTLLIAASRPGSGNSDIRLIDFLISLDIPKDPRISGLWFRSLALHIADAKDARFVIDRLRQYVMLHPQPTVSSATSSKNRQIFLDAFNKNVSDRFLLPLIARPSLTQGSASDELSVQLHSSALQFMSDDSDIVASAVANLQVEAGTVTSSNVRNVAEQFVRGRNVVFFGMSRAMLLRLDDAEDEVLRNLVGEICRIYFSRNRKYQKYRARSALISLIESRRTPFSQPEVSRRLDLPLLSTVDEIAAF
tara:strand:+ start:356 stop:4372 length:4017 start_codon:yes stop_codon:yes gene_type:complete